MNAPQRFPRSERQGHMSKLTLVLIGVAASVVVHAADPVYKIAKEIQIGGDGGWGLRAG
jgi:hypothetical protein